MRAIERENAAQRLALGHPFNLGPPLASIAEYAAGSDDSFADKTLAWWALDDVRAALGI